MATDEQALIEDDFEEEEFRPVEQPATEEEDEATDTAPAAGGQPGVDGKDAESDSRTPESVPYAALQAKAHQNKELKATNEALLRQNQELLDLLKGNKPAEQPSKSEENEEEPEFFSEREKELYQKNKDLEERLMRIEKREEQELIQSVVAKFNSEADKLSQAAGIELTAEERLTLMKETSELDKYPIPKATKMAFAFLFGDRAPKPETKPEPSAAQAAAAKDKLVDSGSARPASGARPVTQGTTDLREAIAKACDELGIK